MSYSLENRASVDNAATLREISKAIFVTAFHRSSTISRIRKSIPGKMKCGLVFQHLPESIHMVRRYEIVGEDCKADIVKLINAAKWG